MKEVYKKLNVLLASLPLLSLSALTGFSIAVAVLLLLGQLKNEYVLSIGVIAAIAMSIPVWLYAKKNHKAVVKDGRGRIVCDLLVLIGVVVWGVFNMHYTSEHLFVNRDPALYALGAVHLINNDSLHFPLPTEFNEAVTVTSNGFDHSLVKDDELYLQGLHLLPALLGLGGRVVGLDDMFHLNVIFGMTALVAVYVFARMLMKPYWAMVAAAVMGASMPLIQFSRDTYSEPLAMTLTFTSLALLWLAYNAKQYSLWFIGGLAVGAGALTRIDAYLSVAAVLVAAAIFVALGDNKKRSYRLKSAILLTLGMAITGLIGWADAAYLSSGYFRDLSAHFFLEMIAILIALIGGAALVALAWKTNVIKKIDLITQKWRIEAALVVTLLTVSFLALRPFWLEAIDGNTGRRSFSENSLQWVEWYIGGPLVILGFVGLMIAIYKIMALRKYGLLFFIAIFTVTSLVYFVKPSINPDQIWASRRYLPVIMPSLVILGVYTIHKIYENLITNKRFKWSSFTTFAACIAISVAVLTPPLLTSKPIARVSQTTQLSIMKQFCSVLPPNSAVVWIGIAKKVAVEPTKELCGVPSGGLETVNRAVLSKVATDLKLKGFNPLLASLNETATLPIKGQSPVAVSNYSELELVIERPPKSVILKANAIFLARIMPDGSLVKIEIE